MAEDAVESTISNVDYRYVSHGKIYDRLDAGKPIDIGVSWSVSLKIDEGNLDLVKVSMENLRKGWERDKDSFTKRCQDTGITFDPFEVYKYYLIQRKTFQVLGKPKEGRGEHRFAEKSGVVKLSETKGNAMCSEYATLSAYIAQKIGEPVHLIVGSVVDQGDDLKWRGGHAYIWVEPLNLIFDSVLATSDNDLPALMKPTSVVTLETLESGKDIEAKRIGSGVTRYYGLEAHGFGVSMDHAPAPVK